MASHSETLVNQAPPHAPSGPADNKLPSRISTNSEVSETNEGPRSGHGSGRRSHYGNRRSGGMRMQGNRNSHGHRRMYSYPGSPSRGPMPTSYPQQSYFQGYGPGMRTQNHFGSMDGSEYGGPNPYPYGSVSPMWMGGPWMGSFDWNCQYGMYMVNPVQARRSERSTRVIFVANVGSSMDDAAIQEAAGKFGTIRAYDSGPRDNCSGVFISFYDVRHAEAAVKGLPEVLPGLGPDEQNPCACYFMIPPVGVPGMDNQGTVAISNASSEITNQEIKAMFAKYGDIRAIWETNPPAHEFRFVEFFDTQCAEAAMHELKTPELKGCTLRLEYAPFAGLEPVQQPQMHPAYPQQYAMPSPNPAGDAPTEADGGSGARYQPQAAVQGYQNSPYGWGPYPHSMPHHHHHHHSYGGEGYLTPRASAPEQLGEYTPRAPEGMWSPQSYMGYGGAYWPYGGQHMMPPMYNEMMSGSRPDGSNSPGRHSNSSESHNWRPHRTAPRTSGDRNYDPSQFEFNLDEACNENSAARTTLMIRNIPNKYSQRMLLDVLNRKYRGCYSFFYLPIDFKNRCNLGYAFVNFTTPAKTAEFYKEFHAKAWEEFNSKKVCEITYARVQGREALVEHFRNSRFPCSDPDYLPLVFDTEDESSGETAEGSGKPESPTAKGTPVHHWASAQQYGSNAQAAVVAAH